MNEVGQLRDRVAILAPTASQDSYGASSETWATVATVWGKVESAGGGEVWQADKPKPVSDVTVTIRYYSGLTSRHRLTVNGRTLYIDNVANPDGRQRWHVCTCREG